MAIRSVEYTQKSRLSCAGCAPADVILCIRDGIVLQNVGSSVPRNYVFATLVSTIRLGNQCGGALYRYVFEYDDVQLIANATIRCTDIEGVVCQGCLTNFIQEFVGNQPLANIPAGAEGEVLTIVGGVPAWAPPVGGVGSGFITVAADSGPNQNVDLGETLTFVGAGEVFTQAANTNQLTIGIAAGPETFVLTSLSGVATWAPLTGGISFGGFVAPPASSTASGAQGSYSGDSQYGYLCIATNSWVRWPIDPTWP